MAHNLEIRNGEASMMYVGETPWHGLGTRLGKPATAFEAIQAAKVNWEVQKIPIFAVGEGNDQRIPDRFAVVRKDLWGMPGDHVLGIVSGDYTPLQNRDAFTFFDPIVGEDAAIYHTAGVLGKGERIWILAKLPDDIIVAGDDVSSKFLLLSNSHDGTSAVQIKFTPIRVVCDNTLTMALNRGETIRVPHMKNIHKRLRQAEQLLGIINVRFDDIADTFRQMVRVQMDKRRLAEYLKQVFPDPRDSENERVANRVAQNRRWAEYFFDQGKGNQSSLVRGTLWTAYNGIAELIDHRVTQQSND